jgi:hypothetical protein
MLKKDSKLTPQAQLKAFGDPDLPVQQKELAQLVVGAASRPARALTRSS